MNTNVVSGIFLAFPLQALSGLLIMNRDVMSHEHNIVFGMHFKQKFLYCVY